MHSIDARELRRGSRPLYRALADALAAEIDAGDREPGSRLPTHRALATELGVTPGTISRAYALLERRGLVRGEVGRGTFVTGPPRETLLPPVEATAPEDDPGPGTPGPGEDWLDLGRNFPPAGLSADALSRALRGLADDPAAARLLEYQGPEGRADHRAAGAAWLARRGLDVSEDRVLVTAGAQHGVFLALSAVLAPGDRLGVAELAYPGSLEAARLLGAAPVPLATDDEGLLPEAVDAACRAGVRAVCCVPTLHNPTNATLSEPRRREIAEIVGRHRAALVEDDLFGLLPTRTPPPLATMSPEHTLFVTSLSKTVAAGLRIGYLVVPPALRDRVVTTLRTTCWMAPPLLAEIAARWIRDGTAERILHDRRREARTRRKLAREILAPWWDQVVAPDGSLHVWLRLPPTWTTASFVAAARAHRVLLTTEAPFLVPGSSRTRTGAVRLCIGTPRRRADAEEALRRVAQLLGEGPRVGDLSVL